MIPVNTPRLNGSEKKYLLDCIESGWISSEGSYVRQFEEGFAKYIGRSHGIATSSGSGALDIAIQSLEIPSGSEVIVPSFTIISPVQSLIKCGLVPVLCDSDLETWNMQTESLESLITSRTKAILVVHTYGLPVDMDVVEDIAERYNLIIIEDAAEAHGLKYKDRMCGSFGKISIFSFYPNKHITTGEGGMVLTNDERLMTRSRKLRNLCFEEGRRFVHNELGWNYRMTNLQAALGVAQIETIDAALERKREIGQLYQAKLELKEFVKPLACTNYADNIYWVYGLLASSERLKDSMVEYLHAHKIGTRPFFWPMHLQPVFQKMGLFKGVDLPNSEHLANRGFYIPSGLGLTDQEINIVCDVSNAFES